MINDFRVAVSTDLDALPAHQWRDLAVRLHRWKPRLGTAQGRVVIGLTVRANGTQAAEKQARTVVADLLRDVPIVGKVTAVEVGNR